MAGGFSEAKEPDEEIEALLTEAFKASLAEAGAAGALTIKSYTVQVVAGTNYLLQLEDSAGKAFSAKIHKPLPHTGGARAWSAARPDLRSPPAATDSLLCSRRVPQINACISSRARAVCGPARAVARRLTRAA